jgi:hypothetical protein
VTRHAKASSAFTYGRRASAATDDARSSATRGASRGGKGSGLPSHQRAPHGRLAILVLSLVALAAVLGAGIVQAATKGQVSFFGSAGSGNGQFGAPGSSTNLGSTGIAVNQTGAGGVSGGDLYVVDSVNNRIERFTADGDFIATFGSAGTGGGQFNIPQGVAVDPNSGAVYVTDRENRRIQKFTAQGNFLRMWGWGVLNGGSSFQICTSSQSCQAGIGATAASAAGGQMATGTASPRVVVDPDNGNVFVSDPGNRRIQEFDSSGNFLRLWGWDVVTTGQAGDLGTSNFEICSSAATGVCKGANTTAGTDNGRFGSNSPSTMAIDANGVLYASDAGSGAAANRVQRFDTDNATPATLLNFLGAGNGAIGQAAPATAVSPLMTGATTGLAVDPSNGHLLVARDPTAAVVAGLSTPANPAAETWVQEIADPGASLSPQPAPNPAVVDNHAQGEAWIGNTSQTSLGLLGDIATRGSSGRIYASRPAVSQIAVLNQPGTQPSATAPTITANTTGVSATFNGSVNPNGSLSTYRFQYRVCPGGVCGSGTFTNLPATDALVGSGVGSVAVSQAVTGLLPNTTYEVQLTADGFGAPIATVLTSFLTPAIKPTLTQRPAAPVTDTTAQLQAEINPNNSATTYQFQWGTEAGVYPNSEPAVPASIGSGTSSLVVFNTIAGLLPNTTYHFRVLVTNVAAGTTTGTDQVFTTTATPTPSGPLERAYEMVSNPDKPTGPGVGLHGEAESFEGGSPGTAAASGERYLGFSGLGPIQIGGAATFAQDFPLSERTSSGWRTESPFNRLNSNPRVTAGYLQVAGASDDLSTIAFRSILNGSDAWLFPEMSNAGKFPVYLRSWDGRWEPVLPTDVSQGTFSSGQDNGIVAGEGSHFILTATEGWLGGLTGPGDPSFDRVVSTGTIYADDVSAGLSDTFPGAGIRTVVNVCTGAGSERTQIPAVDGSGNIGSQACPGALPGRDAALISSRGASFSSAGPNSAGTKFRRDAISADGSRIFFMSPDPSPGGGGITPPSSCSGTGASTVCPPQLYLRQQNPDGSFTARWIARAQIAGQAASLTGPALFEGASSDGDRVFFSTTSPLTGDDPNATGTPGPKVTGSASSSSWDLYGYDFTDSSADDPGDGALTRVSAGPTGAGDCSVAPESKAGGLRFVSKDGTRLYFTCAAPLAGVPTNAAPTNGTVTTASGTTATTATTNLYYYDSTRPFAQRWEFVANLPKSTNLDRCATTNTQETSPIEPSGASATSTSGSCVRGTDDGSFITFWTLGRLTADDPDATSADIYGFDATAGRLTRIDAPQGGVGGTYTCIHSSSTQCYGQPGMLEPGGGRTSKPNPGLATAPAVSSDRIAYFQSRSRLTPDDLDSGMDVYQWRNGDLSLLSPDTSGHAFYAGNGASGRDVFIQTDARLTWQDHDAERDVYDARIGGGFPEPLLPPLCAVLADGCQNAPATAPAASGASTTVLAGAGNVVEKPRKPKKPRNRQGKGKKQAKKAKQARHANRNWRAHR